MNDGMLILALSPILVLSLALALFCLYDLVNRPSNAVRGGNKWVWGAVILFINLIGPLTYLFVGRTQPPIQED